MSLQDTWKWLAVTLMAVPALPKLGRFGLGALAMACNNRMGTGKLDIPQQTVHTLRMAEQDSMGRSN